MNKKILYAVIGLGILGGIFYLGMLFGIVPQTVINNLGSVTGPDNSFPCTSQNGLVTCIVTGTFADATTTLLGFDPDLPATSTIEYMSIQNTGVATSTYNIQCGAVVGTTTVSVAPTRLILNTGDIATSTNFGMITNNVTVFKGSLIEPSITFATSTLYIGKTDVFSCKATTYGDIDTHNNAFSNVNNTFEGKYLIKFVYPRW